MRYQELESSTKFVLQTTLAFLVLAFLWVMRDIVVILLLAVVLASAMEPLADYLHDKRIPRVISVLFVYLIFLGLAALVISLIVPPGIAQYKVLQANLPEYGAALQARLGSGINIKDFFAQLISGFGGGSLASSTFGIFNGVVSLVTVLVISFYLVAEERGMKTFFSSFLPEMQQEVAVNLIAKIQKKMGFWVLGQLGVSVCVFLLVYVGLSLFHVQYALFLALMAGLFEVMPYIGPALSGLVGAFFAFIQNPSLVIPIIILYFLIHQIEGYVLVPKIMQKAVGTSPLLILLALLIGFKLAGVVGLLIAVPLSTVITVVVNELWPAANKPV